ncbi:helix-turn-helix transcriptional regulator [Brevibacillus laterosporus]|uniref:helix-turn-helix domain-containing protein n=1 Tax=Brevibacillus laterosporus TaxID=1465 RepID=UPI0030B9AF3D
MIQISTIGNRIKLIRKMNKVSQVNFSSQIGVSQATLSELEQDKYKPSVETIIALVTNYEVNIEWLIMGTSYIPSEMFDVHRINEMEGVLLSELRRLKIFDQEEILGIIRLKIQRYKS